MWTDERVALLTKLWSEGLSGTVIASRIGGVTRNAVIGKVHRLGLASRGTSSRKNPCKRRADKLRMVRAVRIRYGNQEHIDREDREETPLPPRIKPRPLPKIDIKGAPPSLHVATLDLDEHHCRWPDGDPRKDFDGFCGHEVKPDRRRDGRLATRFCEFHDRIVHHTGGSHARS